MENKFGSHTMKIIFKSPDILFSKYVNARYIKLLDILYNRMCLTQLLGLNVYENRTLT